jgi:hypothetical protein
MKRKAAKRTSCEHIGSSFNQRFSGKMVIVRTSNVKSSSTETVGCLNIGAFRNEVLESVCAIVVSCCPHERRFFSSISCFNVSSRSKERVNDCDVTSVNSPMKRSRRRERQVMDVGSKLNESLYALELSILCC